MGKGNKAREYKPSTVRRLDMLSGNECAAPDCVRQLIARDKESIVSKICHIEAASKNGPRFRSSMTDDERRGYDNLVLLCDECHTIIDNKNNEKLFPVTLLKDWKLLHEDKNIRNSGGSPSALKSAINAISDTDFESNRRNDDEVQFKFNIPDKIEHNFVKRHCSMINEYKVNYGTLNSLYKELEDNGSFRKDRLLRNIRNIYLKVKGRYILDSKDPMMTIRKNADEIFDDVQDELILLSGINTGLDKQDLFFAISTIMVDGFMRCKI